MPYSPPSGNSIVFDFTAGGYSPPAGNALVFNFSVASQSITVNGIDAGAFGTPVIYDSLQFVTSPTAIFDETFGTASVAPVLSPSGFEATLLGSPHLRRSGFDVTLEPQGFKATLFGGDAVETADFQCIPVNASLALPSGLHSPVLGTPTVANSAQGVSGAGFESIAFGVADLTKVSGAPDNRQVFPVSFDAASVGAPGHVYSNLQTITVPSLFFENFNRAFSLSARQTLQDTHDGGLTPGGVDPGAGGQSVGVQFYAPFGEYIEHQSIYPIAGSGFPAYETDGIGYVPFESNFEFVKDSLILGGPDAGGIIQSDGDISTSVIDDQDTGFGTAGLVATRTPFIYNVKFEAIFVSISQTKVTGLPGPNPTARFLFNYTGNDFGGDVGTPTVAGSQVILADGFLDDQFGDSNARRYGDIFLGGFDVSAVGTPSAVNVNYIYPEEICPYRIFIFTRVVEVPHQFATGVTLGDQSHFGLTHVELQNRELLVAGFSAGDNGVFSITHYTREVAAEGSIFGVLPPPKIELRTRYVVTTGISLGVVGEPTVQRFLEILPSGWIDSNVGIYEVAQTRYTRTIYPPSFSDTDFSHFGNVVYNRTQEVGIFGIIPGNFGRPTLDLDRYTRTLNPATFYGDVGTPTVQLRLRYLSPDGIPAGFISNYATIYRDEFGTLLPGGFVASVFGTPQVALGQAFVRPLGINAGTVPTQTDVSGRIRRIIVDGLDATLFGNSFVDQSIRTLDVEPLDSAVFGITTIDYRERFVSPLWFSVTSLGRPTVGRNLTLFPVGFDAGSIGAAHVLDNSQTVYAFGFTGAFGEPRVGYYTQPVNRASLGEGLILGTPIVYNSRQYARQVFDITPYDGGVFGHFNDVANRNRTIAAYGAVMSKVPTQAVVENKAVPVLPPGFDASRFGTQMVAYAIRTLNVEGIDSAIFTRWHVVYNDARVVSPFGFNASSYGTPPSVFSNLQTLRDVGRIEGTSGTPTIGYRVRGVQQYFPYEGPPPPSPVVQLYSRYLVPAGIASPPWSTHEVHEHFNIVQTHGAATDAYGNAAHVYNLTPELHAYGHDSAAFGTLSIRTQFRYVPVQGVDTSSFGRPAIEYRTRTVFAPGLTTFNVGLQAVRLADPGLPSPQTIEVVGFTTDFQVPGVFVHDNRVYPRSITSGVVGAPSVTRNSIIARGFSIGDGLLAFGFPTVSTAQYVSVTGIEAWDAFNGGFAAHISPRTIWATFDVTGQTVTNSPPGKLWTLMDSGIHTGPDRPDFGTAVVENRLRAIFPESYVNSTVPQPKVELKDRTIFVSGLRAGKFGFPHTNADRTVIPVGRVMLAMGVPTVDFPTIRSSTIRAEGFAPIGFASPIVSNYVRTLEPTGFETLFGVPRVHPPEPLIPAGFNADLYGDTNITNFIRTVSPEGFEGLLMTHTPGFFKDRLRVRIRNLAHPAGFSGAMGVPTVDFAQRTIHPWLWLTGETFGALCLTKQNRILLGGYGFDASAFGDVDRWEAGKIKPHGDEMTLTGIPILSRVVRPSGADVSLVGVPSMARPVQTIGDDDLELGDATVTHANNDHVCGSMRRGIPVQTIGGGGVGTPVLS